MDSGGVTVDSGGVTVVCGGQWGWSVGLVDGVDAVFLLTPWFWGNGGSWVNGLNFGASCRCGV